MKKKKLKLYKEVKDNKLGFNSEWKCYNSLLRTSAHTKKKHNRIHKRVQHLWD